MISLVVPCFNEAAVLLRLFERIQSAASEWPLEYEVILIDDGSDDDTWRLIERFHERDPRWKGVVLARNFGHQAALGAGFEHASGDVVAVLDADLQDPPEMLTVMLEKWREGFDVVYGIRRRRCESWFRRLGYWFGYRLLGRAAERGLPADAGDFCLMDRRVISVLRQFPEQSPFWRGLRWWSGFRQTGVAYDRPPREAGESRYSFRMLCKLAADGLFAFSWTPLRLIRWLGGLGAAIVMMFGLLCLLGVGEAVSTRVGLWSCLFLGCVQILCLGVLGEYLGRIYQEVRRRPRWIVAETLGWPDNPLEAPACRQTLDCTVTARP